jgi:hypothetical protein
MTPAIAARTTQRVLDECAIEETGVIENVCPRKKTTAARGFNERFHTHPCPNKKTPPQDSS